MGVDPVRLAVPKAYVVLAAGHEPTRETALAILRYTREHLAPYKRIRRIEFAELFADRADHRLGFRQAESDVRVVFAVLMIAVIAFFLGQADQRFLVESVSRLEQLGFTRPGGLHQAFGELFFQLDAIEDEE